MHGGALEAIPQIARLSDESESERVIISTCASAILEIIDALTAERARAEKAEAKFAEADRRLDLAIKWIADSRWDSAGAGRLLNQIDIPYRLRRLLADSASDGSFQERLAAGEFALPD